ncbi:MAG: HD-GYP domain-containing protein [Bryobacteraceae bacterium]|jgi:putative nucleotidyltransferase with HDIG domain
MRQEFWTPRAGAYVCLVGAFLAWTIWSAAAPGRPYSLVLAPPLFYAICRSYRMYVRRCEERRLNQDEIEALHLRTIEALSLALDAKDPETRDHLGRVRVYAVELAREMGVCDRELECLRVAALLHDIGKLALPERIISKPGKLTPDEFEKVKAHPLVGAEILQRVGFDPLVPAIVRAHHERWDGSGYPDGLVGGQIPLGARILSAVDALDALSSDRSYRKALPLHEAMREVALRAGASFDPEVVDLLARRYEELERKVSRQASPCASLSLDIRVDRAAEPAAGFEAAPPRQAFGDRQSAIGDQPLGCG